ncbi:MAG: 4Fe-4S binding protein [Bacteroidaceae bacterium]
MKISTIRLITFSPTGGSDKIGEEVADEIASSLQKAGNKLIVEIISLTRQHVENIEPLVPQVETLYICAVPVYSGRVAKDAMARIKALQLATNSQAACTPVIPIAVYGNRDYEDALVELYDYFESIGFLSIAAGAFIGEHSYSNAQVPLAAGRPDAKDQTKICSFGQQVAQLIIETSSEHPFASVKSILKGNRPYREGTKIATTAPIADPKRCINCGKCVEVCPTGAISKPFDINVAACIQCCACVKVCPEDARFFETPIRDFLNENCKSRREPEMFFAG